jgi:hypothetical protein
VHLKYQWQQRHIYFIVMKFSQSLVSEKFFLFTYNSGFCESVKSAFWVILGKAIPLVLMILWFISCRHCRYRVILVPIVIYAFQLFSAIKEDIIYVDTYEMCVIIPVVIVTLSLSYLTRFKLQDKIQEIEALEKGIKKPSDYFFKD